MVTIATFAEEIDQNLYIIPSSIHELIFLPDDGYIIAKNLEQMIKDKLYPCRAKRQVV